MTRADSYDQNATRATILAAKALKCASETEDAKEAANWSLTAKNCADTALRFEQAAATSRQAAREKTGR